MDQFEIAAELEQRDRERSLGIRKKSLPACGNCYNCGESCVGCFCDHFCSEDFEQREMARERGGNVT